MTNQEILFAYSKAKESGKEVSMEVSALPHLGKRYEFYVEKTKIGSVDLLDFNAVANFEADEEWLFE